MSGIDRYLIGNEQQQQQQQRIYSSASTNTLSLSMDDMIEINLTNITNRYSNDSTNYLIPNVEYTTLTYKISLGFICACLCLLAITGNLLVLITFRRIRTVGNLFILSLATADLIVGCFVMPIAGIYAIMEKWNMGLILCQIWLSVDFTASTASIFNLLTLSLDRYWSITSPLQYLGKRTRTRALFLIGFAWGLSLLWVIPIFGWHRLVNNGTRYIDSSKCDPEYAHSKVFKVSTAIINFYLPLLVLISLNGRIYYEIKRRYKNALLQRYSNKSNESPSSYKLHPTRKNSHSPITMTMCDSERQLSSTILNFTDNDSLTISKHVPISNDNNSSLRINYKERKHRPTIPMQLSSTPRSSTYSFVAKNHCTQDELTWYSRHERSRSSLSPHRAGSKHRLYVDERCFKHAHDSQSSRIYSNEQLNISQRRFHDSYQYYQTQHPSSRRNTTTTMNIFSLCHCCSAATSSITIHSNLEPYNTTQKALSSSLSSITSRKQHSMSSYNIERNSVTSNIIPRSNSYVCPRAKNKIKQATVWNQQEKAFRQLFAIVFGFTLCFLPYFILYMVVAFCGSCVSERIVTATIWLGYVNSTINPFLYALSNKHFRRTFNRILKRDQRRQSFYN